MLREKIQEEIKTAMRARDQVRLDAIKYLWSEIRYKEIDKKADLTDEEIVEVLMREVKKRKEAIEQIRGGGREELAVAEEAKLKVLMEFLPEQMGKEEVEKIVNEVMSGGVKEFGIVMKEVMGKVKGKADGKLVSEVVKKRLSN